MTPNGRLVLISCGFFLLGMAATYLLLPPLPPEVHRLSTPQDREVDEEVPRKVKADTLEVTVVGDGITTPGNYAVESGYTVGELVDEAGGFTEDAIVKYLDESRELKDGSTLSIPTEEALGEIRAGQSPLTRADLVSYLPPSEQGTGDQLINVNRDGVERLRALPGIGDVFAERIVRNRENKGSFDSKRDLKRVHGIGENRLERIRPFISLH